MRLRWAKLASHSFDDIAEYIAQDSHAAACRVVLELMERAESALVAHPAAGRAGRLLGIRELVIGSLPYVIAYRVSERQIEILRVLHTSRRWLSDT